MTDEEAGNLMGDYMPPRPEILDHVRPADNFLLSHPRSGSRWLRLMLIDLVNRAEGMCSSQDLARIVDSELSVHAPRGFAGYDVSSVVPSVVENLHRPSSIPKALGGGVIFRSHHITHILKRCGRVVYTFRWPPAVLLSYYHFAISTGHEVTDTPLEAFFRNRVWHLLAHMRTMLKAHEADPERIQFVDYHPEAGPLNTLQLLRCARHWDVRATAETAAASVEFVTTVLTSLNSTGQYAHSRGSNQTAEELPPALLDEIDAITGETYRAAVATAKAQDEAFQLTEERAIPHAH